MATWSTDAFGNDYAMDWAQDLHDSRGLEAIEGTLDMVVDHEPGELEAPFAAEALAAIDVITRLLGRGGDNDIAELDAWVAGCKRKVTQALVEKASRAIDRILGEQSELRALWQDSEHYEEWRDSVDALRARLAP